MKADDRGRTMPNAKENIILQDIMILRSDLVKYSEAVHARLAPYKGAWRDLRCILAMVRRLQVQLWDSLPDRKVAQLQHMALEGKFLIEMPGPVRKNRFVCIDEDHLSVLMQCAMIGECTMCLREGRDVKRCPLRAALIAAAPPDTILKEHPFGRCEYQDTACALARGEDVEM